MTASWEAENRPVAERSVLVTVATGGHLDGPRYVTKAYYVPRWTKADDEAFEGDLEYCEVTDKYCWPEGWYADDHIELISWRIGNDERVIAWAELPDAFIGTGGSL